MSEPTRKSVEASGKNVEDAVQKGLAQLGVRRDQVEIRVITEGSRGILGIGAEDARVRLSVLAAAEPRPVPVPAPLPAPVSVAPPNNTAPAPQPQPATPPQQETSQLADVAAAVLREILQQMGIAAQVTVREAPADEEDDGPVYLLDVRGGELNTLIGRRGDTLDSLQYLTRLIVQHRAGVWASVIVDVDGYRARREETLRNLAKQMADRVERDGRSISLEPMPPYERRIVHIALREHPSVMTMSVGEGDARKVTIRPRR